MNIDTMVSVLGTAHGYAELRRHCNTAQVVRMVAGNLVQNGTSVQAGVSARVRSGGAWGFASCPDLNRDGLKRVVGAAWDNARFMSGHVAPTTDALAGRSGTVSRSYRSSKPPVSDKERLDFVRTIDGYIDKTYPDLQSRTVTLSGLDMDKSLVTADGTRAELFVPRTHIVFGMTYMKDGVPVDLTGTAVGGLGQFEDLFDNPGMLYPKVDALYQLLRDKSEGVRPQGGIKTCVLAPDLAGILAHEAVGHTVEYDLVRGGSVAGPLLGQSVASPLVSIVDFAHSAFGETCPVPVHADDEGVLAEDAILIDRGVLKGYMHSRQTAGMCRVPPTGNGRAFAFSDAPLIRMRNTCILPGECALEDMIASVEDGYYFSHPTNGQADLQGEFMFGVSMGYEIKNGKRGRAIQDTTVSGVAFDMLKTVSMVGDTVAWVSSGYCGKGQRMSVGMGGPALVCRIHVGGE